jgi:hypothetical protein
VYYNLHTYIDPYTHNTCKKFIHARIYIYCHYLVHCVRARFVFHQFNPFRVEAHTHTHTTIKLRIYDIIFYMIMMTPCIRRSEL